MQSNLLVTCLIVVLAPLLAAIVAGFFGHLIGKKGAHVVTIFGVSISFVVSLAIALQMFWTQSIPASSDISVYTWAMVDTLRFQMGFLIDPLTILMMLVVSFVSLMVHIYTIGYMQDDPGYQRFFSYISLFTFAMLTLVMSNNFLQLFFGWEAVGLVSYLLIGFWFKNESAIFANLKAFLVNRIGDFGFLLGIALTLWVFGSLDYAAVFAQTANVSAENLTLVIFSEPWSVLTLIAILLFIGAMGKSAQMPLHVWLPDSMEGPTPISALIHAATMVTAGVFMVARMSPIFEYSETALTFVLFIGTATCFLMGLVGIVQNDIKRVVAYSTLSQLGLMMAALGVSAYGAGIFHLMTHAFFKALLFLGAGSVIIAMHHEQDIRLMGGLRRYMPITYFTMLIGTLALVGFPFFSGFYSKDTILEAVQDSSLPGAAIAYWIVLGSVFVTALYSFRMFLLVFHTKERMDKHTREHLHESPTVVWVPLVLLAFFSVIAGIFIDPLFNGFFDETLFVLDQHDVIANLGADYHGMLKMGLHGFIAPPFGFALAGFIVAWLFYEKFPHWSENTRKALAPLNQILVNKYGFDTFNEKVIAPFTRFLGGICWKVGDQTVIDGVIVNGSAHSVGKFSNVIRHLQTGYIYHYAFAMISGLIVLLTWLIWRN